ncbi:phosphoinositide binding protein [Perilla frutescens var. hirtella]|uniref:Phosphoinositide binding protein n=1 Tax=Perilla frutescens var. hirtella TaxID=608512 RepID=A0AAD4JKJ1_PERFH|nr:phosphoinositide binding protein [Perilla frutescens var. hirtella]
MLEKIGLPPKPSLRGNTWVVDASHCQGCSSQFTFINRKHHCRRCGGIFCGSCSQQRMVLRGQGDSPVRICEPCKKLEEAARFEMRYGHKNKASRGGSKNASKKDDEILNQTLGSENTYSSSQKSSASCSNTSEVASQVDGTNIIRNLSLDKSTDTPTETGSATPADMRQQALLEKQKYKTLKAEGKPEEALKAFKKGKELERQAAALEITLRKNSKKALSSSNIDDIQQNNDEAKASGPKNKLPSQKSKGTNDLSAELKELGWSDLDLHDAEKKPGTMSLEGELSSLLREVYKKPDKEKRIVSTDKSEVIAHKKRALELKRAGNLVEAKEELKRAKILERKIEEEELLGGSDDSDDELSSLVRSMDADERADFSGTYKSNMNFDFDQLIGMADDIAIDGKFEITDDDMNDPEMFSALKSLGWEEDAMDSEDLDSQAASSKRESLVTEIQSLKREALNQKRSGNSADALALLRKAKQLEKDLENSDAHELDFMNEGSAISRKGALLESVEESSFSSRASTNDAGPKSAPKSKLMIQKELIALKKKALALRREGKLDESDEELRKAKTLEEQLEDMNKAPSVPQPSIGNRQNYNVESTPDNGEEEEVTDQDLHDPSYLSLLKNLGWDDDNNADVPSTLKENNRSDKHISGPSTIQFVDVEARASKKSKNEIQRELLMLKRKALTLRRQGEAEEAEEVLNKARLLEEQLNESEEPIQIDNSPENNEGNASNDALRDATSSLQVNRHNSRAEDSKKQVKEEIVREKPDKIPYENEKPQELHASQPTVSQPHSGSLQQEILAHKRKALAFKRDGKLAEAKEELRQAKLLEKRVEETHQTATNSSDTSASDVSSVDKEAASPSSVSKPLSSRERFKLQQESLGHKRQALKLRREGKTAEADALFELAKAIESQLQESDPHDSAEPSDDVSIEDFLDPQLMSALQSIGLDDGQTKPKAIERPEPTKINTDANTERAQLVEQIKAEKVKAVNLKRSGKQAEALDALRRAKLYEKKLQSLS